MYNSTNSFTTQLNSNGVIYDYIERRGKSDLIVMKYRINELTALDVLAFFEEDCENVAMRCFTGIRAPQSKRLSVYEHLNRLNATYRCVKFYFDGDEISVGCDTVLSGEPGDVLYRLLGTLVNIVELTYSGILACVIE